MTFRITDPVGSVAIVLHKTNAPKRRKRGIEIVYRFQSVSLGVPVHVCVCVWMFVRDYEHELCL